MSLKKALRSRVPGLYNLLARAYQHTPSYRNQIARWESRLEDRESEILASLFNNDLTVRRGPFQGMHYLARAHGSRILPKIAGCYEHPVQKWFEQAIGQGFARVVDVGSAEGYYAVGLALRIPGARVLAYDLSGQARQLCRELARRNGVAGRVTVLEECNHEELNRVAGEDCLVVCDIEGSEITLLDPHRAPSLRNSEIIVETHECLEPGVNQILAERFCATHRVETQYDHPLDWEAFPLLREVNGNVREFIADEFRPQAMSWMRMTPLKR